MASNTQIHDLWHTNIDHSMQQGFPNDVILTRYTIIDRSIQLGFSYDVILTRHNNIDGQRAAGFSILCEYHFQPVNIEIYVFFYVC